ncbi:hypothetical protein ACFOLC_14885 [Lysobacter cavernae]|uniref:Energy transducer TonB n=1 Tax=Lysobacter cavernae TaxID=1685901 RepID=A0ABV7RT04_9GAMM
MSKLVEISLLVKGSVEIEADGSVIASRLDEKEKLPAGVVKLVDQAIAGWKFEPVQVEGRAVKVRAPMSLRVVAKEIGDEFTVRISGVDFGTDRPEEFVTAKGRLARPPYPAEAVWKGVGGTVYLVMQIGRDGKPMQIVAEQVNLTSVDNKRNMEKWRALLAEASTEIARRWRFNPPTKGSLVDAPYWTARVPVDFVRPNQPEPKYGQWYAYIPGPRQEIPWLPAEDRSTSADTLVAGGVYPLGTGPRLLTPPSGS